MYNVGINWEETILISYLQLIVVYVIQTMFVELVSDGYLMMILVAVVSPLFVRFVMASLIKNLYLFPYQVEVKTWIKLRLFTRKYFLHNALTCPTIF